ncbi:MAG: hypothetical protein FJZ98_01845, partial [Chloroflexi bacterium]|nr:hypothetical protein [Chloroflexota bacterium]
MKSRWINLFWGLVLVGAGVLFYLREIGWVDFEVFSAAVWVGVFGVLAFFFLLTYGVKGVEKWGWLFPALIFASVALTIAAGDTALGDALSGAPILLSVGIPFFVAFALDPQKRRVALIPAWAMVVLTAVIFLEPHVNGNLIGALVLFGIGFPFLVVYLLDRSHRWALIPFGVMTVIGFIPLLETFVSGQIFDLLEVGLLAVPFYVVFFWSRKNWWALIPAGVFTSVVIILLIERMGISFADIPTGTLMGAVMNGGLALTFGVLWLMRGQYSTSWAIFPAAALLAIA